MAGEFAARVLQWFERHGRKHLPWQQQATPYRVWISEIMLQQTQVNTVIPYFERFTRRFPDVASLANADQDEVLHHWSGLGYYARARNLHAAAKRICEEHDGRFPQALESVSALPGIGRSTAGAILSLSLNQRHAILDGNVKRVLARHAGIDGWPGRASVLDSLWEIAERRTPAKSVAQYNQAMMDLGATVCTRGRPKCESCPVSSDCVARKENRQLELPAAKPRKTLPERSTHMLVLEHQGCILLKKRPPTGIWGGLWSLPETEDASAWIKTHAANAVSALMKPVVHTFSHFRLHIQPFHVLLDAPGDGISDDDTVWYDTASPPRLGLAAPVKKILQQAEMIKGERDGTHG